MKPHRKRLQGDDPFSTPARRRRIIADFSKAAVRKYALEGCSNIYYKRLYRRNATVLQCFWRKIYAKWRVSALLGLRKCSAATRIQCKFRSFKAKRILQRLKYLKLKWQERHLAVLIFFLVKKRKHRFACVAKTVAMQRRRHKGAVAFQRLLRGLFGRKKAYQRRMECDNIMRRRNNAAMLIQSHIRRVIAMNRVRSLRRKRLCASRIAACVRRFLRRRRAFRYDKCITIQRIFRGYRSRMYASRLRKDKEERERRRRLREWTLQNQSPEPIHSTLRILIEISVQHLIWMVKLGPRHVIDWSLRNFILRREASAGFVLGSVVQQVVDSVRFVMQRKSGEITENEDAGAQLGIVNVSSASIEKDHEIDKIITLDRWHTSEAIEIDGGEETCEQSNQMPTAWQEVCELRSNMTLELRLQRNGIDLVIIVTEEKLLSSSNETEDIVSEEWIFSPDGSTKIRRPRQIYVYEIIIALEDTSLVGPLSQAESSPSATGVAMKFIGEKTSIDLIAFSQNKEKATDTLLGFPLVYHCAPNTLHCAQLAVDSNKPLSDNLLKDLKFRFQNALIFVTNTDSEEASGVVGTPLSTEHSCEVIPEVPVAVRPKTAVVQILLHQSPLPSPIPTPREPSPLPPTPPRTPSPVIDYDLRARRIQSAYRVHYDRRVDASTLIQLFYRRSAILITWQAAVYVVIERAYAAAMLLQSFMRKVHALCKLRRLRREYAENHYTVKHDFLKNERDNWKRFGMDLSNEFEALEAVQLPLLRYNYHDYIQHIRHKHSSNEKSKGGKLGRVLPQMKGKTGSREEFGGDIIAEELSVYYQTNQVLSMIELPRPPPGCVLPQEDVLFQVEAIKGTDTEGVRAQLVHKLPESLCRFVSEDASLRNRLSQQFRHNFVDLCEYDILRNLSAISDKEKGLQSSSGTKTDASTELLQMHAQPSWDGHDSTESVQTPRCINLGDVINHAKSKSLSLLLDSYSNSGEMDPSILFGSGPSLPFKAENNQKSTINDVSHDQHAISTNIPVSHVYKKLLKLNVS